MSGEDVELLRWQLIGEIGAPGAGGAPLTVLAAPVGYGKTTLLRQWRANLDPSIPVEWADGADLSSTQCEELILNWETGLAKPSVMVIDNFEAISTAELDAMILRTAEANQHAHFVVAGRRFSFLDTPLATNRVDSKVMRRGDLVFSSAETKELLAEWGAPVTEAVSGLVHAAGPRRWPLS